MTRSAVQKGTARLHTRSLSLRARIALGVGIWLVLAGLFFLDTGVQAQVSDGLVLLLLAPLAFGISAAAGEAGLNTLASLTKQSKPVTRMALLLVLVVPVVTLIAWLSESW